MPATIEKRGKGALVLGLAGGVLSGGLHFRLYRPDPRPIPLQKEIATGVAMLALFGIGHVLPLVVCGMFSARTMELLHSSAGRTVVATARKLASVAIAGFCYLVSVRPERVLLSDGGVAQW